MSTVFTNLSQIWSEVQKFPSKSGKPVAVKSDDFAKMWSGFADKYKTKCYIALASVERDVLSAYGVVVNEKGFAVSYTQLGSLKNANEYTNNLSILWNSLKGTGYEPVPVNFFVKNGAIDFFASQERFKKTGLVALGCVEFRFVASNLLACFSIVLSTATSEVICLPQYGVTGFESDEYFGTYVTVGTDAYKRAIGFCAEGFCLQNMVRVEGNAQKEVFKRYNASQNLICEHNLGASKSVSFDFAGITPPIKQAKPVEETISIPVEEPKQENILEDNLGAFISVPPVRKIVNSTNTSDAVALSYYLLATSEYASEVNNVASTVKCEKSQFFSTILRVYFGGEDLKARDVTACMKKLRTWMSSTDPVFTDAVWQLYDACAEYSPIDDVSNALTGEDKCQDPAIVNINLLQLIENLLKNGNPFDSEWLRMYEDGSLLQKALEAPLNPRANTIKEETDYAEIRDSDLFDTPDSAVASHIFWLASKLRNESPEFFIQ